MSHRREHRSCRQVARGGSATVARQPEGRDQSLGNPSSCASWKRSRASALGVIRIHYGLFCSRLIVLCRHCSELGGLGGLARCGSGALSGLLGPRRGVSRVPGGCLRLQSGFLGGRSGSDCPSSDRSRFVRGHRVPLRRTPIGQQLRRGTVLGVSVLRHALRPLRFAASSPRVHLPHPPRGPRVGCNPVEMPWLLSSVATLCCVVCNTPDIRRQIGCT